MNNPVEYLSQFICPHLVGTNWQNVRKATLFLLVTHESNVNQRIRLHILLKGSAGTGKTVFLSFIKDNLQGVMINAEMTSKTGLVGDARGKNISSGLLHSYDGNIVNIDELDKMNVVDQGGLLQAMEEGSYMIVKGQHRQRFKAEIRAIASVNEISKIMKPLRDRFDFHFDCVMSTRRERAGQTKRIVDSFFKKQEKEMVMVLQAYLLWIGDFKPDVEDEQNYNEAVKRLADYIRRTETKIDELSYRSLELSVLRIAWALAKIHKRNIHADDVTEAVLFKDHLLKENSVSEYKFYQGRDILNIAKTLAERTYGEKFTMLSDTEQETVLKQRTDLLKEAKVLYSEHIKNTFTELEKMRMILTKENAFDLYVKENETSFETNERNDSEMGVDVVYNVKKAEHPLTLEESEKISNFFTVKELKKIFGNYGKLSRSELIMKKSMEGVIPAPPIRKYICKTCGEKVIVDTYCSPHTSPWTKQLCEKCYQNWKKSTTPP